MPANDTVPDHARCAGKVPANPDSGRGWPTLFQRRVSIRSALGDGKQSLPQVRGEKRKREKGKGDILLFALKGKRGHSTFCVVPAYVCCHAAYPSHPCQKVECPLFLQPSLPKSRMSPFLPQRQKERGRPRNRPSLVSFQDNGAVKPRASFLASAQPLLLAA